MSEESIVSLANRMVPMTTACREVGLRVHERVRETGTRLHCPFEEFAHPDGGRDPAFRVWADHGFCFACWEYYSPVKLYAQVKDVTQEQAAVRLLDLIGYKPASYAHHWRSVAGPPPLDLSAVAQALRNFCDGYCDRWQEWQLEPYVAEYLSRCLGLLGAVTAETDARAWLAQAKQVMTTVLDRMKARHGG